MITDFFDQILLPEFLKPEFEKDNWYLVIGSLKRILEEQILDSEINSNEPTLITTGKVYIGHNCKISPYVVIEGPVYIDDDVEIGPHANIRPGSIISKGCSIGHAAEVKNSIMMERSKIANHTFLGDSIIGVEARLGGHTETANRRFDQKPIEFSYNGTKLQTGLDKLGIILGERSRLGGGVMSSPGTMIGKDSLISTLASVSGYIPPKKFLKVKNENELLENRLSNGTVF